MGRTIRRRRARAAAASHCAAGPGEQGFSLIEVMIALVVIASLLGTTTSLVITSLQVGQTARLREVAADIASSTLDCAVASLNVASGNFPTACGEPVSLLNAFGYSGLDGVPYMYPTANPAGTVTRGGTTYSVEQEVQAGNGTCGTPSGGAPPELEVVDWVTWASNVSAASHWWLDPSSIANRYVEESTVVAVPAVALNPADGSIKVTVTDDANNGQPDLDVVATDTSTNTQTTAVTTGQGCALFLNMAPGPYSVSVTPISGVYIDSNNDMNGANPAPFTGPNMQGTVNASATLTLPTGNPAYYAEAAYVDATYTVPQIQGLTWAAPYVTNSGDLATSLPLSFWNSELNGLTTDPSVGAAPTATGDPVFPFELSTPSYYVVAGSCGADSAPDVGGATTDGVAVPSATSSLVPGSLATANFTLAPVALAVANSSGEVAGASLEALPTLGGSPPTGASDPSCSNMPALHLGSTSAATAPVAGGATALSLISSADPIISNTPVTLTATASTLAPGTGTPTGGSVTFYINGSSVGTAPLVNGVAAYAPSPNLTTGATSTAYTVSASYSGSGNFQASNSVNNLTQTVEPTGQGYAVTVGTPVPSADPSIQGDPLSFQTTVTSTGNASPSTGTVTLYRGGSTVICTATRGVALQHHGFLHSRRRQ